MSFNQKVSERYVDYHPGYKLLSCETAALPLMQVFIRALVQEKTEFSPVEEFVMRAIGFGIQTSDELSSMFGLEIELVTNCLTELWQRDLVDSPLVEGHRFFRLTRQGEIAVAELKESVTSERDVTLTFDLVTGAPIIVDHSVLEIRDIDEFPEIHLIKGAAMSRVKIEDIRPDSLNQLFKRFDRNLEILSVRQLVNQKKLLIRGDLLIYESVDSLHHLVEIAVDGRIWPEFGKALENLGVEKHLGISFDLPVEEDSIDFLDVREKLTRVSQAPVTVSRQGVDPDDDVLEGVHEQSEQGTAKEMTSRSSEVKNVTHRFLDTYEHPEFLEEAISSATSRLLIISPWVKENVVTVNFVDSLNFLAKKGVLIHIGYGIEDRSGRRREPNNGNHPRAEERLQRLAAEHSNVVLAFLGNTHAKVLLWDNNIIQTSFNWLSFKGDQGRTYRQERGTLLRDSPEIDDLWTEDAQWIERQSNKVALPAKESHQS